ncbi:MAG: hypothetical protein FJ279_20990 [Planctomycetes bacterium]|nr:hypothetical protein [Planctomycetota bacterium]
MPKADASFEQSRKALLERVLANTRGQVAEKVIPFRDNQDVPNFLRWLDKVEQESRKSRLVVK